MQREGLKGQQIWEMLPLSRSLTQRRRSRQVKARTVAAGQRTLVKLPSSQCPAGATVQPSSLPAPQMPAYSDSSNFTLRRAFPWFRDKQIADKLLSGISNWCEWDAHTLSWKQFWWRDLLRGLCSEGSSPWRQQVADLICWLPGSRIRRVNFSCFSPRAKDEERGKEIAEGWFCLHFIYLSICLSIYHFLSNCVPLIPKTKYPGTLTLTLNRRGWPVQFWVFWEPKQKDQCGTLCSQIKTKYLGTAFPDIKS